MINMYALGTVFLWMKRILITVVKAFAIVAVKILRSYGTNHFGMSHFMSPNYALTSIMFILYLDIETDPLSLFLMFNAVMQRDKT